MQKYREELEDFLKNRLYMIVVVVVAIICYGFAATNTTISIDDLRGDDYLGDGNIMLSSGRFGMVFWSKLFGFKDYAPAYTFAIEVLAVVFLIWAAINFCILFKRVSNQKITKESMLVFSAVLISYPLMNEIWEYSAANLFVCGGYLFVSFTMLMLQKMISEKKLNIVYCILSLFFMIIVASSYESLIVVYVFMVTAILLLQEIYTRDKFTWKSMFGQIVFYVSVLIITLLGRLMIGTCILKICNLEATSNGATEILWGNAGFLEVWEALKTSIVNDYIIRAIVYFPLTELLISCVLLFFMLICIIIKNKSGKAILPVAGMYVSLVFLSIIQGSVTPYRACQVFGIFVAFVAMLFLNFFKKWKKLSKILLAASAILIIQQSMYLSYFLNLNHLRSEEEAMVIKEIGNDLSAYGTEKPVIFLGEYSLSDYITESASIPRETTRWWKYSEIYAKYNNTTFEEVYFEGNRKIVSTNVKSVISWAAQPDGGQFELKKIFNFYGFDYRVLESAEQMMNAYYEACNSVAYYWDNVGELNWKNGYAILETDAYIIVHLR